MFTDVWNPKFDRLEMCLKVLVGRKYYSLRHLIIDSLLGQQIGIMLTVYILSQSRVVAMT